jgi:hypothetical protein
MRKKKQNRNKKDRRRRSNWQRHSPSSICSLRNSCPRILPALQAENFSLEEAVARITLFCWWRFNWISRICNAVSYADRHSSTQQQSRTSLRQRVLPTSPLCNAGQCVCCLVAAMRQERCDPAGWPARPGRSARHQIQIITVDEFFKLKYLFIYLFKIIFQWFKLGLFHFSFYF